MGDQPDPVMSTHMAAWEMVETDLWIMDLPHDTKVKLSHMMRRRDHAGREKYGMPLRPFNGRDTETDLIEEVLDAVVYFRTLIYERTSKNQPFVKLCELYIKQIDILVGLLRDRMR